ncbi:hypothetical protein KHQ81_02750 [Mycoplasmatota bacterium]|nr:hypothetical protein KHQ81_02750 [Mycoplasmatota bacterium]
MEKIYPNCFNIIPVPTEEGYLVFRCNECGENWLYQVKQKELDEVKCPYCGRLDTLNHYYEYAYQDSMEYYHMIALKNLLSLINVEVDLNEIKNGRYKVQFMNVKEPNESEMNHYVTLAYQELKKRLEEKTIEIKTKIPIQVQDIVDLDGFTEIKTTCCNKPLKVKVDKKIHHCIYCNSDLK